MENSKDFYDRLLKNQFNEEEQLDIVRKDPSYINYMIDASINVQEAAIWKECNTIRYIRNQSEWIKVFAINQNCLFKYIENPSIKIKEHAIKKHPINIIYIDCPSNYLLDLAIDEKAIKFIRESLEYMSLETDPRLGFKVDKCDRKKCEDTLILLEERRYANFIYDINKNTKRFYFF